MLIELQSLVMGRRSINLKDNICLPKHQRNESNRMQRIIYKIKRYVSRKIGNVLNFQWWGCKENINISQVGPETFHSKQIFLNIFIDHLKDSKDV